MQTKINTYNVHKIPAPAQELLRRMTEKYPKAMPVINGLMDDALGRICRLYQPNASRNIRMGLHLRQQGITLAKFDQRRLLYKIVDGQGDFTWPFTYINNRGELKHVVMEELRDHYVFPEHMVPNLEWVSMTKFQQFNYSNVWAGRLAVPNAWNDTANVAIFGHIMFPVITQFYETGDRHGKKNFWSQDEYVARYDGVIQNDPIFGNVTLKKGEFPLEFLSLRPDIIWDEAHNPDGILKPTRSYKSPITGEITTAYEHIARIYARQQERLATGAINSELEFVRPMIWGPHCEEDTFGQLKDPVIQDMTDVHARTRDADTIKQSKSTGMADMFGAYLAEDEIPGDPTGSLNIEMLEHHQVFDEEAVSGEALWNCVIRTMEQKQEYVVAQAPHLMDQTTFLEGTSTPILGTEPAGEAIMARLKGQGLKSQDVWEFGHSYLDRLGW